MILDEPGTGLDIKARAQMLSYVRQIAQTKMTIIYVTHYLDEIPADFTKTVFLKDGRIAAQGETKELFRADNLERFLKISAKSGEG